jgi:hypothetical protein
MKEIKKVEWNVLDPKKVDNYICDLGAYGVALCWWDNEKWVKMWTSEFVKVWGWIEIPTYNQNK